MADYAISNVPRRVVYAASGTGPYAFTFEILDQTDIAVYKASTLLTLTTDYTVTINANGTGSVTLVATAGSDNITIVGAKNIQRTSDFTTGGDLFADTLNDELDNQTIYIQQVAETAERGLKAPVTDPTDIAMTLPAKAGRAGKVLAFDETTGNPVAGPSLDSVVTVIEQSANINTVADNIADVITVADNTSNINTVSGISGNVTTVAGIAANVTAVAGNATNVNTVATNIANVNTVGGISANVTTVAGISAAVTSVAADATDIGTVAANIANVNAVAAIDADVSAVAGDATNIGIVAADIADVNTVAGIAANVTTVASISTNVVAVDANSTNVNTVATNIANVNIVGNNISNVNAVASNSTNINSVAGNSANINTVAGIAANVTTVATNNANVTTVATNIASVNTVAGNTSNINQVASDTVAINSASANASTATTQAGIATTQAAAASASAAAASAVALGNEPVRHSIRPSLLLDFANTKTLDPRITFTRASTGTFYDGKTVAKAEENLLIRSEEFDNGTQWSVSGTSVTANSVASPDGATTADTIVSTTNGAGLFIRSAGSSVTSVSGQPVVLSVFAKANTHNFLQIVPEASILGSAFANFDLSAGTVGSIGGTGLTASIVSVGNSWYRCIVTISSASGAGRVNFYLVDSGSSARASSYTGTVGNSLYLWGAQAELRSSVTAYTATTTAPITNYIPALQTAASGVARFEHNPVTGESLGLEIEEQRTNLFTYSEQFNDAAWTKLNTTISANAIVAPDGTLTGDKLVANSGSSTKYVDRAVTVAASTTHTFSAYMKAGEYTTATIYAIAPSSPFENFSADVNLSTGAVTNIIASNGGTIVSATATSVGNGWWRVTLTGGVSTKTSLNTRIYPNISTSFTGNDFSGIYIWGAQLEAGSFATSYIPTVASQVTRSADAASMTGTNFSSWYRADEGTLYGEATSSTAGNFSTIFAISDGTTPNRMESYFNSASAYGWFIQNNSATQVSLSTPTLTANTFAKVSAVYKTNDFAYCANAQASVGVDTLGTLPIVNRLTIGGNAIGNSAFLNGTIKKLAYYPKRLTNAELQGVTTV